MCPVGSARASVAQGVGTNGVCHPSKQRNVRPVAQLNPPLVRRSINPAMKPLMRPNQVMNIYQLTQKGVDLVHEKNGKIKKIAVHLLADDQTVKVVSPSRYLKPRLKRLSILRFLAEHLKRSGLVIHLI